jgi:TRAP-type C4-dicarboxylate transport system permease small subunit
MTAIYNLFPEKFKSFVDLICKLTIVIIALYIAKISLDIMLRNYDLKINTQVLDLPYWTIYLVILISFVLIAMTSILALFPETKLENEGNSTIEEQGADTK